MRQTSFNIFLIVLFIALAFAVLSPLMAEIHFNLGRVQESKLKWKSADKEFRLAGRLDPLNAEYLAGRGEIYAERAKLAKRNEAYLLEAEKLYESALELSPYNARYLCGLAEVMTGLFFADKSSYDKKLDGAIMCYKKASMADPYNFVYLYDICDNLSKLWKFLDGNTREFIIAISKRCVECAPRYQWQIDTFLWEAAHDFDVLVKATPRGTGYYRTLYAFVIENGLWKHRKGALEMLRLSEKKDEPVRLREERDVIQRRIADSKNTYARDMDIMSSLGERNEFLALTDWQGISTAGNHTYRGGNMYWTGIVTRLVYLPPGMKSITIKARGTRAFGIYPYMIVSLDDKEIGETYVANTEWDGYTFFVDGDGLKVLSVTFTNDGANLIRNEDRNLYVGDVEAQAHE